jgi:hypothetical protein
LLPGAGLAYLGKWKWGFFNLGVVLLIGLAAAFIVPDETFEKYVRYIGIGCAAGSGGLAQALATQMNQKGKTGGSPTGKD